MCKRDTNVHLVSLPVGTQASIMCKRLIVKNMVPMQKCALFLLFLLFDKQKMDPLKIWRKKHNSEIKVKYVFTPPD